MPYESMHHHQSSAPNGMLDSLSLQLRDAEMRRTEIERAHQVNTSNKVKSKLNFNKIYVFKKRLLLLFASFLFRGGYRKRWHKYAICRAAVARIRKLSRICSRARVNLRKK